MDDKLQDVFWLVSNFDCNPEAVIKELGSRYILLQQGDSSKVPNHLKKSSYKEVMHSGHNLSDYLRFIIDNYSELPDRIGFIKGNIFPRHIKKKIFIERAVLSDSFIPLYSSDNYKQTKHKFPKFGMLAQQMAPGYYLEESNDWYVFSREKGRYFPGLADMFIYIIGRDKPRYIPFVPGGCMIVSSYNIKRWPIELYQHLFDAVTYAFFPVEAYHLERCMLYLFCYQRK